MTMPSGGGRAGHRQDAGGSGIATTRQSLIEQPAIMSYYELATEERLEIGIKDNLIRYAVGIEDADDLVERSAGGQPRYPRALLSWPVPPHCATCMSVISPAMTPACASIAAGVTV
jgi:hypothetical protein